MSATATAPRRLIVREGDKNLEHFQDSLKELLDKRRESYRNQTEATFEKLIIERRLGVMIRETIKPKAGRPKMSHRATISNTLTEYGITRSESHRWQRMASVSEEKFKRWVRETQESGKELTQKGLLTFAAPVKRKLEAAPVEKEPTKLAKVTGLEPEVARVEAFVKNADKDTYAAWIKLKEALQVVRFVPMDRIITPEAKL